MIEDSKSRIPAWRQHLLSCRSCSLMGLGCVRTPTRPVARTFPEAAVFGSLFRIRICAGSVGYLLQSCRFEDAVERRGLWSSPRWDRCDQSGPAEDIHHPGQFMSEHAQRHFCGDVRKPLHEKARGAHPSLDRAEGVFDGFSSRGHGARRRNFERIFLSQRSSSWFHSPSPGSEWRRAKPASLCVDG